MGNAVGTFVIGNKAFWKNMLVKIGWNFHYSKQLLVVIMVLTVSECDRVVEERSQEDKAMVDNIERNEKTKIICNRCGRNILYSGTVLQEDILKVEKDWGYFSQKDGIRHKWNMCEACYDEFIKGFVVPIVELERTEII